MWKNQKFWDSRIKTTIFTSLLGAIACGCTSLTTPNVQQENNVNINTPTSTAAQQVQNVGSRVQDSANPVAKITLKEGMLYRTARELVMQQGWQPNLQGDAPNLRDNTVRELFDFGYKEVKDCAGTGLGPCRFEFTNKAGELLWISAIMADRTNTERVIWRWGIDKGTNNHQQAVPSTSEAKPPFIGTRLFNFLNGNGTGQSIAIAPDGTTIVKLNGKFETLVQYQGKFSNPIKLQDGSGLGLLLQDNKIYSLSPDGQIARGCKGEGTICESSLIEVSSPRIIDGFYVLGGTDQGLEVKGEQYRYYDEGGTQEWRPTSELNSIKEGLVFDGKNYWCIPPRREVGVCSANGWVPSR
ncbi:hypothetical protein H6G33_12230 [Calothrix sp. FACHB-1219]|uniref:hypothetical protein n=1 Tax=unclassified Calothrix TaxID=2619626 RepID=UPI001681C385|nr:MULTISPECIES: hypothetical protein [unclassified Calothrix]MBD2202610.1 hypothetical protein [Calothrix sp. FACHB-168]MBD2217800.1 hypothetical protein [Calothrix sp. FACHB-1219]